MLDPDGDGDNKDYYEIQINPQNLVFDSQFDDYNQPKNEPDGPFGHQEWTAKLKSAVSVKGTLDKPGDKDQGYVVEALMPWKAFEKAKKLPPEPGGTWRMNFYAMQNNWRRLLVPDPRPGQLPQGVALRTGSVGHEGGRWRRAREEVDESAAGRACRHAAFAGRRRRGAEDASRRAAGATVTSARAAAAVSCVDADAALGPLTDAELPPRAFRLR